MNKHPERPPIRASTLFLSITLAIILLVVEATTMAAWTRLNSRQLRSQMSSSQPPAAPQGQALAGPSDHPAFDAVSIKLSKSADPRGRFQFQPGGRFVMTNIPLRPLISMAYSLPPGQGRAAMIGAPGWIDSETYNIEPKAEGNPPREQMILMPQSLLVDRFKLIVHWDTREMPIYALVMVKPGKTGPQLVAHADDNSTCRALPAQPPPPLQPGGPPPRMPPPCGGGFLIGPGHMSTESTMETLAKNLSWFQQIDRAVVDKTGLSGTFDISLDYVPFATSANAPGVDMAAANSSLPSTIFTALQEQLGLKLESQMGPVEVLVIDHVEQPSEN